MVDLNFQKYPAYKSSGVEWLGDIPEHWEMRKLKYIAIINMGQSPNSDEYSYEGEGKPFLQGNAEFGKLNPSPKIYCKTANKYADSGDILLSVRAPVGALNIANQSYGIGRGLCAIKTRQEKISPNYTWYLLMIVRQELYRLATGSTYDAVSVGEVASLTCILPPLLEQQAIANFLDKQLAQIDKYISKKQRMIELLKEQKTVIINQAVTKGLNADVPMKFSGIEWLGEIPEHWEVRKVKHLAKNDHGIVQTGPFGAQLHASDYVEEGVPLILIRNVKNLHIDDSNIPKISEEKAQSLSIYRLQVGDIVFSRVGSIGRIALVTEREKGWMISGQMLRLRINHPILYNYFSVHIFSSSLVSNFVGFYSVGSTRDSINTEILRNFVMPIPPLPEQKEIALFIEKKSEKIERSLATIEKEIKLIQEYRTTLISETVTGKIKVING
ncbi:restriction endonuclease subunit S [Dapis sp. BLCC M126]|uniref:restriction endonuclease subunit S n=1 Tax=Dapis sp. BLCC M126 TaxID=3400189 RepID=UPI003CE7178B